MDPTTRRLSILITAVMLVEPIPVYLIIYVARNVRDVTATNHQYLKIRRACHPARQSFLTVSNLKLVINEHGVALWTGTLRSCRLPVWCILSAKIKRLTLEYVGPAGCPETSMTTYQSTLRNATEERRSHSGTLLWKFRGEHAVFISDLKMEVVCSMDMSPPTFHQPYTCLALAVTKNTSVQ